MATRKKRKSGFGALALVLLIAGGWAVATLRGADPGAPPAPHVAKPLPVATLEDSSFACDGRDRCPQMRSCAEARWVLRHCPGTKMDGDGDGIPCETQHCTAEAPALAMAQ